MILGNDDLSRFLREVRDRGFDWPNRNCLLLLADWIVRKRGVDPGAAWRGLCADGDEAFGVTSKAGGVVALVEQAVEPLGIKRAAIPQRGDIAVVEDPIAGRMGAIVMGSAGQTFALLMPGGLLIGRFGMALVQAWRV